MQNLINGRTVAPLFHQKRILAMACAISMGGSALFMGFAAQAQGLMPDNTTQFVRLVAPEARQPIQLRRVAVQAEIAGLAVATRIELEVYNPNDRVLEAELEFPLLEGQAVTGFALDINGEMRPAVPVTKAKGQQVFEDVTRTRVDPALLESTGGQNYKLRIYPIAAKGSRRVVLEISESVRPSVTAAWRLPLWFAGTVKNVSVDVSVTGSSAKELSAQIGATKLAVKDGKGGATIAFSKTDWRANGDLRVDLPRATAKTTVSLHAHAGATYFYAEVAAPAATAPRAKPDRLALVWDASGSGARRDHGREFALLDAYFKSLGTVTVSLVAVRDVADAPETFTITDGQWGELKKRLESLPYDGATNLSRMKAPADSQLALLFSDGLGNYGDAPLPKSDVPLYTMGAMAGTDANALRLVAENSGGGFIDLTSMRAAEAVKVLSTERTRVTGLSATGANELETLSVFPEAGRLAVSGVMTDPEAEIVLDLATAGGVPQRLRFKVAGQPNGKGIGVAAHRWASMRLARLEADAERNKAAIVRLGTEHRMVTRETSLIVLDSIRDYVRYEIEPPAMMRTEWRILSAENKVDAERAKARQLDRIVQRFEDKKKWYDTDFPKDLVPPKPSFPGGAPAMAMAAPPAPVAVASAPRMESASTAEQPAPPSIQLRKWAPDEPYARRLRAAEDKDLYAIYLDERPSYLSSSAFFLDVADILTERKQPALAARVLSNLAEMSLENRHLLRILSYRLVLSGEVQQAVPMLKKVLALSPGEPQSYRDLGLALAKAGKPQEAVDHLYEVVSRPWNGRFPGVELIALAELNAIVATNPGVDTGKIDPRLLRNMPLDLRAVMTWDADNTDIDLWVIDPNGEKAYYAHRLTRQGGRMSEDFTGGFGPEEYSLRTAMPGTYTVVAQFYGHRQQIVAPATTLMLKLTTGFGTPNQKDEDVVLRLTGQGRQVTVGTFNVGGKPLTKP